MQWLIESWIDRQKARCTQENLCTDWLWARQPSTRKAFCWSLPCHSAQTFPAQPVCAALFLVTPSFLTFWTVAVDTGADKRPSLAPVPRSTWAALPRAASSLQVKISCLLRCCHEDVLVFTLWSPRHNWLEQMVRPAIAHTEFEIVAGKANRYEAVSNSPADLAK